MDRIILHFSLLCLLFQASVAFTQQSSEPHPDDSLTAALCNNQEQIVAKGTGDFRIEYYMGETQLNMKTMSGFLNLNSASIPYYRQFKARRISGVVMLVAGIGFVVADRYIPKPAFPIITIGGITTSVCGIGIYFGANEKFRRAIYAYNKDICKIK